MFKKENPCDPLAGIHRKETYMIPQVKTIFSLSRYTGRDAAFNPAGNNQPPKAGPPKPG
jgi:hypothetical protein